MPWLGFSLERVAGGADVALVFGVVGLLLPPQPAAAAADQNITFPQPADRQLSDGPLPLNPAATSGLPVTLNSATTGVCTVSDLTVAPVLSRGYPDRVSISVSPLTVDVSGSHPF